MRGILLIFIVFLITPHGGYAGDSSLEKALVYLRSCQNPDGGFGEANKASDPSISFAAVLAIVSSQENPLSWTTPLGHSALSYVLNYDNKDLSSGLLAQKLLILQGVPGVPAASLIELKKILRANTHETYYGSSTYPTDDFWLLMADQQKDLLDQGSREKIVATLLKLQNPDGGWGFEKKSPSDSNMTSLALLALGQSGLRDSHPSLQKALSYLEKSGAVLSWIPSRQSDVTTLAYREIAGRIKKDFHVSTGISPSMLEILSFQQADGSFSWTHSSPYNPCYTTAMVLPSLSNRPFLPFEKNLKSANRPFKEKIQRPLKSQFQLKLRFEGPGKTLSSGMISIDPRTSIYKSIHQFKTQGPDILAASIAYLKTHKISFSVFDTFGDSFSSIASVNAAMPPKHTWHYKLNKRSSEVCSVTQEVQDQDEIIWYFGQFGARPLRVSLSKNKQGLPFHAVTESFNEVLNTWEPEGQVLVKIGSRIEKTNTLGVLNFDLKHNDRGHLQAEKEGFVRSEALPLAEIRKQTWPTLQENRLK